MQNWIWTSFWLIPPKNSWFLCSRFFFCLSSYPHPYPHPHKFKVKAYRRGREKDKNPSSIQFLFRLFLKTASSLIWWCTSSFNHVQYPRIITLFSFCLGSIWDFIICNKKHTTIIIHSFNTFKHITCNNKILLLTQPASLTPAGSLH